MPDSQKNLGSRHLAGLKIDYDGLNLNYSYKNYHDVDDVQWERLLDACKKVALLESLVFKTHVMHWNFARVMEDITRIIASAHTSGIHSSSILFLQVSMEIQKILESFKIFLEHSHNDMSEEYKKVFREEKDALFNNHFGFRFVQELRNFGQHNDLPISHIKVNAESNEPQNGLLAVPYITISRTKLLTHRRWGGHESTLLGMPEDIEILPILNSGFNALQQLNDKRIYAEEIPKFMPQLDYLISVLDPVWDTEYFPVLIEIMDNKEISKNVKTTHIPLMVLIHLYRRFDLAGGSYLQYLNDNQGVPPLNNSSLVP